MSTLPRLSMYTILLYTSFVALLGLTEAHLLPRAIETPIPSSPVSVFRGAAPSVMISLSSPSLSSNSSTATKAASITKSGGTTATAVSTTLATTATVSANSSSAASSSVTVRCDRRFCTDGNEVCLYWAGITGWDPVRGVVPGETMTTLGKCDEPVVTASPRMYTRHDV